MMWYHDILELRSRECYHTTPLQAISEDDWLHTNVGRDNNLRLVNDVTDLRHNAFAFSFV